MKVFLSEQLTARLLSRYSDLIDSAEFCWSLKVESGATALSVLDDARWQAGSAPFFESIKAHLARWVQRVATSQTAEGRPLPTTERALLSYGLEARLWAPAIGGALVRHSASKSGCHIRNLAVEVVADNPYLRDAFAHAGGIRAEVGPVRLHRMPGSLQFCPRAREVLAGNSWLRSLALRHEYRGGCAPSRSRAAWAGREGRKTAALFVLNQRFLDVFQPVLAELTLRGWRVLIFYYNQLTRPATEAIPFNDAAIHSGPSALGRRRNPQWLVSDESFSESPVSRAWLSVAMNASWVTGWVQICRHRRVLESWRPDVVISYGHETMSLALKGAADSLGVPSLFMAHGFQGPMRSSWFFPATASALFGSACVKANEIDPNGARRQGLVATGHPPYDALLTRSLDPEERRGRLSNLGVPIERPYIVLVLATVAPDLLWCSLLRRTLKMLVEALPGDAYLVCKLHPSREERAICEAVLGAGLPPHSFTVVGESEYSTADLLDACHVAVANELSMSLRDAIVMGRPAVAITDAAFPRSRESCNPLNYSASDFKGACRVVNNAVELRTALIALTRDEDARHAVLRNRTAYIEQFLCASDGRSSVRVADLVEHLGAGKDPDSFFPTVGESLLAQ